MIKIIGKNTGKVYAEGPKGECFRRLIKDYPYQGQFKGVYPEPLKIIQTKRILLKQEEN